VCLDVPIKYRQPTYSFRASPDMRMPRTGSNRPFKSMFFNLFTPKTGLTIFLGHLPKIGDNFQRNSEFICTTFTIIPVMSYSPSYVGVPGSHPLARPFIFLFQQERKCSRFSTENQHNRQTYLNEVKECRSL